MLKKLSLLLLSYLSSISLFTYAQKSAYVDTDYILNNIPEYKMAQETLDKLAADWQKEIDAKYEEIDKLYKAYQADALLLTEDMRKKRENEIINKEKEVRELQKQRFGVDGELFKKRQELVKPIQDKVYNSIKAVAERKRIAFVFDKTGAVTLLYTDSKYDISEEVIKELGIKKK